jgi:hypothetical protein
MKTRIIRPALALAALLAGATPADDPPVPAFARQRPEVRSGDPVLRFNGRDLDGFYTYLHDHKYDDPEGVFTVRDGVLRVSGKEFGGFATREEFENYHLIVEWRWGEATWPPRERAARDSGILLHCVGPDGAAGGQWMESIECQIIEGGCGDFILVAGQGRPRLTVPTREGPDGQPYFDASGMPTPRDSGRINWWGRDPGWKDVLGFRGRRDVEKPAGAWNRMEVICDGATITNIVNGYVVNQGTDARPARGKILFQSEGAEIHFRTIEVRPLLKAAR